MSRSLTHKHALALLEEERVRLAHSPNTIQSERRSLRRVLPKLGKRLDRVRRSDVEGWTEARLEEVSATTVARELSNLRKLYQVLAARGRVEHDPTAGLSVGCSPPRRLILSEEDVGRLLAEASRPVKGKRGAARSRALALRTRALVELLYATGMRAGEVVLLKMVDLDLAERTLRVRRVKGCRGGTLPLPDRAAEHLEHYLREGRSELLREADRAEGALFVSERGSALAHRDVWRTVAKVARRAGVEAHPHALRRSVATHLARNGASLLAVQSFLGHRRIDTTQRYVGVGAKDLRRSVEVLSDPCEAGSPAPRAKRG